MNLSIADAPELVLFLHDIIVASGRSVMTVEGWEVSELRRRLFFHRSGQVDVGGPYQTLGALLRVAGFPPVHTEQAHDSGEVVWEVVEWGSAYFVVRAAELSSPTRHESLSDALVAGRTERQ